MEPKPEINQLPQQSYPSANQPRNPGPPINQYNLTGPRPPNAYPGENQPRPPPIQRLDSRSVISQPQQPLQTNQQFNPQPIQQQRPLPPQQQVPYQQQQQNQVPRPLGAPTPQFQQPRLDNLNKGPPINRPPNQALNQQPPQQNRPAVPLQNQLPNQLINQQLPPQRLPFNRPPGPTGPPGQQLNHPPQQVLQKGPQGPQGPQGPPQQSQFQGLPLGQGQGQGLVQGQQGQGPLHASQSADGPQNIRLNSGQFRPQNPYQPQNPIPTPNPNPNLSGAPKLPSFIEERRKMSTDINPAANYIISNTDDVDDVIVRPISQTSISSLPRNDTKPPLANNGDVKQSIGQPPPKPKTATPEELNRNSSPSALKIAPKPDSAVSFDDKPRTEPATVRSPVPQGLPPSRIVPPSVIRKPSNDDVVNRTNGSAAKPIEKVAVEPGRSQSQSRASSHKSQEDVMQRSTSRTRMLKLLEKPAEPPKKVSMNKIKVGNAPPPNLRQVRSKIGSLENAAHKPGGGKIKIETKKVEFNAQPRITAKNSEYAPGGGDKKITSNKLQWNAKSKIGSLENASHKPGGGDKKILTVKTDFRDNAKPKVGSKDNSSEAGKAPADIEKP